MNTNEAVARPRKPVQTVAVEAIERLNAACARLERQGARLASALDGAQDDRLSTLLEVLPAAVVLIDGRDRVDRFNPAAERLLPGLRWGRRWNEVLDEHRRAALPDGDWLLDGGRRVSVSSRLFADGGRVVLMLDTTERREREEQHARRDRLAAMGEMAAQLAHQIRTPLSAALLYGGQLARGDLDAAQRAGFAERLLDGLRHTERLIGDMLAFSRGAPGGEPSTLPVDALIDRAVDCLAPRFSAAACVLEVERPDAGAPAVSGNRDALQGVIENLLDNALAHAGQTLPGRPGRVRLSVTVEGDRVEIRVEDDGPGVPPDVGERVFDPFFTTRERGTGLGLAVAQSVVLAHGGDLSLCASSLGGAGFRVRLPLAATGDSTGEAA